MKGDIFFEVLGNTGPFSMAGESSGYKVSANGSHYLLECGAPIFPSLGFHGVAQIKGLFASHSHEDHKRWFTDLVLFCFYNPSIRHKVRLITAEPVMEEYHKNSKAALERSLSPDSKRIVDIPFEDMVEKVVIGPRSKYFVNLETEGNGAFRYRVRDRKGNPVGPEKAKIFINPRANRPRLLFKDDETGEWVEPDSYYPFSSNTFYEENQNTFRDEEADLTVKAVKCSAWHGVPTVAFRFMTQESSLFFSADTVYKPSLWKELYETYRPQNFEHIPREAFEKKSLIIGDINDFIERVWSRERYESAMSAYEGSVVIHDVARKHSVVHTDYPDIAGAPINNLIFTHNPDNLTARHPILKSGKILLVRGDKAWESVNGGHYPFDADVYVRHFSGNYVGYKRTNGAYKVIEKDGLLGIVEAGGPEKALMRVDLFMDIGGEYFPVLKDTNKSYRIRPDGRVEESVINGDKSIGRLAQNRRGQINGEP